MQLEFRCVIYSLLIVPTCMTQALSFPNRPDPEARIQQSHGLSANYDTLGMQAATGRFRGAIRPRQESAEPTSHNHSGIGFLRLQRNQSVSRSSATQREAYHPVREQWNIQEVSKGLLPSQGC